MRGLDFHELLTPTIVIPHSDDDGATVVLRSYRVDSARGSVTAPQCRYRPRVPIGGRYATCSGPLWLMSGSLHLFGIEDRPSDAEALRACRDLTAICGSDVRFQPVDATR